MRLVLLAWTVATDPTATRRAYEGISLGASALCGCAPCRNFDAARPEYFPSALGELLCSAGIDPRKEAVVRLVAPLERGLHLYSGSYVLCGEILVGRPLRGFPFLKEEVDVFERVAAGAHVALRPWLSDERPWAGHACVRVEFLVVLPWVVGVPGTPAVNLDQGPPGLTS